MNVHLHSIFFFRNREKMLPTFWNADISAFLTMIFLGVFSQTARGDETNSTVVSSIVSYQFYNSLTEDTNSVIASPIVSYQYLTALSESETTIVSPIASYLYYEWPGDENLNLSKSPQVSYFYNFGAGAVNITVPPASKFAALGSTATFSVQADGLPSLTYQWLFNGANISAATSSTLTLNNVSSANWGKYSVSVGNAFGPVVSKEATLAVLDDPANGVTPAPSIYSLLPPKQATKDSLIVLTHGYQWSGENADVFWMEEMTNSIKEQIAGNWQLVAYKWLANANHLATVVHNAKKEGVNLGKQIAAKNWNHVHLIGHSAGSALIQSASETIKANSPATPVHTTFLDAYVGIVFQGQGNYGEGSDWSDSYFTYDPFTGGFTGGSLDNAYNVNISGLIPGSFLNDINFLTSHTWPHDFYQATVINANFAGNFGFPLSKEAGGWDNATNTFRPGNSPPRFLGANTAIIPQCAIPTYVNPLLNIDILQKAVSQMGIIQITDSSVNMQTALSTPPTPSKIPISAADGDDSNLPAWLSVGLTLTNFVNFVSFDAQFTSTNASGLLTVYWNTNLIGSIDEETTLSGLQNYILKLPDTFTNGSHVLGFRVDSFTNTISSITITNVITGYSGLTNPVVLSISQSATNRNPSLILAADAGFNYLIQSSTNLVDWTPLTVLVGTNSATHFFDPATTNFSSRFYRAISP